MNGIPGLTFAVDVVLGVLTAGSWVMFVLSKKKS